MWGENSIFQENISDAVDVEFIPWNEFKGKSFFVTGATGLVGFTLIRVLLEANRKYELDIKLHALVRNLERAEERFAEYKTNPVLIFHVGSVENIPAMDFPIDYIVHSASQTKSKEIVGRAVETIQTAVLGTHNVLELAKSKNVGGLVYLSSMEMYGHPERGHKVTEEEVGALSPLDLRNSYPISKLMCESMCCAYAAEYNVPAKIVRLTQTIGASVNYDDTRIFSYFAKCVEDGKDIVLKTKGDTERSYLHTTDATTAILTILLKGQNGQAYNCADESSYCSISEMAEKVAKDGGVSVRYEIQDEGVNGFPKPVFMDLDTTKLRKLGWKLCSHQ